VTGTVYPDPQNLFLASAKRIEHLIANALQTREPVALCLTGGGTARDVYAAIAANERQTPRIEWSRLQLFWGDERDVPPDHPDSNYGMAAAALLNHVPVHPPYVHRIPADGRDPEAAARAYEMTLQQTVFAARAGHAFDLMLLGIGPDTHVASLFPGAPELAAPTARRVVAVPATGSRGRRITLTPETLLDARRILVMVSGRDKADAVHAAFLQPEDVTRWPAQILRRAADRVEWLMESAAAARVPAVPRA
jgi:6-phosphogluconolactonase